ncbi:hypothetical protein [Arenibacterium halophilum]|uniref:Protein NO VEIN C-terminal domain-containing protein n=1 Tax=Arenibacterium halophilum TaxID=2583821 RepID=A0ABY2X5W9_9RHOB|nr:hypothetical protein [Arenibacterium halophilum]TMV10849.1 hypothetical protein FGK64_19005 [Arenibacterium halophilum]
MLTANERDGKADAWRDYQQILSELGLIVSTKLSTKLVLTDVAKAFVAGVVSFKRLVQMQVFRYQYPNGQKHDRSKAIRDALHGSGITVPDSLIDLHVQSGVLIKPGVLILQVLLGLLELGEDPSLSADECRAILLPCKTNDDWEAALTDVLKARSLSLDLSSAHSETRLRRNIQDWFKILDQTGLFETDGRTTIALSEGAKNDAANLKAMCQEQTKAESFWLPRGHDIADRLSWFQSFGSYDFTFENVRNVAASEQSGSDDNSQAEELFQDERPTTNGPVRLIDFDPSQLFTRDAPDPSSTVQDLAQSVLDGAMKRHAKTVLHDQIVLRFAERYLAQGAQVKVDPNSVDLFVKWGPNKAAIFEVKTVSQRSLSTRMRLAVGQVKEYAYRLRTDAGEEPEQAIIIDRPVDADSWQRGFLNDYLGIGLICSLPPTEKIYAPSDSSTSSSWAASKDVHNH